MAVMAQWSIKTFEVSTHKLTALENLSTSLKLKKENKNDDGGAAPTNVRAFDPQPLDFEVHVGDAAGVDVRKEFEEWLALAGEVAPFYLGGQIFGPDNVQLVSTGLSDTEIDGFGRIRSATIALSFREWAPEAASKKGRPGSYVNIHISTAVNIGPSVEDKASKKPYSI